MYRSTLFSNSAAQALFQSNLKINAGKKVACSYQQYKQRTCVHILAKLWEILIEYTFFSLSIKHKHKDFKFYHGPCVKPEFLIPHL